jgi:hypothetical protein
MATLVAPLQVAFCTIEGRGLLKVALPSVTRKLRTVARQESSSASLELVMSHES